MGRSYVEMLFRHRILLVLPLVGFLVGTGVAYGQPRTYRAISSVWVDAPVPAESSVVSPGTTPLATQQSVQLTQYLTTRTFLAAVAENGPASEQFAQAGPVEADDILAKLAKSVSVSAPGPQLLTVSVTTRSASDATQTATALLAQFESFQTADMHREIQSQVDYNKGQLDSAAGTLAAAEGELTQARRSSSGRANDPAVLSGADAVERAQKAYADASTAYTKSTRVLAVGESTGLRVIDEPDRAWPQARIKILLIGAAGGTLAGATLSLLALLVLMARDSTVRDEQDAARALSLDVVGAVPLAGREVLEVFSWAQAEDFVPDPETSRQSSTIAAEPGKAGRGDE